MLLIPIRLDVLFPRLPIMNYVIIAVTSMVTFAAWSNGYWDGAWVDEPWVSVLRLEDWSSPLGWVGMSLLHADFFHWFFNMAFLWVFGNAICAKVGNWRYLGLYLLFTLASSWFHLLISNSNALGASGSINGIIGFYLALYPINQIKMFYWFFLRPGTFQLDGYWVIGFWLLGDVFGAVTGGDGVAYGAHLGGFMGGMALAMIFLKYKLIEFQRADNDHLFQRFFGRFNVDDLTPAMSSYCSSLGSRELRVRLGDVDEQVLTGEVLGCMMQTKHAQSSDLIYSVLDDEWLSLSRYFFQQIQADERRGVVVNPTLEDRAGTQIVSRGEVSQLSVITQTVKVLSLNIRSWGEHAFYVHRDGSNHGPYPAPLLADYYEQGYVTSEDLVFDAISQKWLSMQEMFVKSK